MLDSSQLENINPKKKNNFFLFLLAAILSTILTITLIIPTFYVFTETEANTLAGSPLVLLPFLSLLIISSYLFTAYYKRSKGLSLPGLKEIVLIIIHTLFGIFPGIVFGYYIQFHLLRMVGNTLVNELSLPIIVSHIAFSYKIAIPYTIAFVGSFVLRFLFSGLKLSFFKKHLYQSSLFAFFIIASILLPIITYNALGNREKNLIQSIEIDNFKDFLVDDPAGNFKKLIIEADLFIPKKTNRVYVIGAGLHSFKSISRGSLGKFKEYVNSYPAIFVIPDENSVGWGIYYIHGDAFRYGDFQGQTYASGTLDGDSRWRISKGSHKMIFEMNFRAYFENPYSTTAEAMRLFRERVADRQLYFTIGISDYNTIFPKGMQKNFSYVTNYYTFDDYSQ